MSLGKKITILFVILGPAFIGGAYLALDLAVSPAFNRFEEETASANLSRVTELLQAELKQVDVINYEYSSWDETYEFALGNNPEFETINLDPEYWHSIGVDIVAAFDINGNLVSGHLLNPENGESLEFGSEIVTPLAPGHPFLDLQLVADVKQGILAAKTGPLVSVSRPILSSMGEGPAVGFFFIGRFLSANRIAEMSRRTSVEFSIVAATENGLPPHVTLVGDDTQQVQTDVEHSISQDSVESTRTLRDIYDQPVAAIRVLTPRTVSRMGDATVQTALVFMAGILLVLLISILVFFRKSILKPVAALTKGMESIRQSGDLTHRLVPDRGDEIGQLTTEFNALTAKLQSATSELEKTRDTALAMSKSKSEFLARMSHEIRTPMNGVIGMTELLQGTIVDPKHRRFTDTIHSSAVALLHIINDILDFSKIEAGELRIESMEFDLCLLLEDTASALAGQAQTKGLELVNDMPTELQNEMLGDAHRLRQILTNLVANAIKFTEAGEVVIRSRVVTDEGNNLTAEFEVVDSGIGIRPQKLDVIFDSFAQEDGSTTRLYGGTGLGLSICRQLVEMMGGEISVMSEPGQGSTFRFWLPMKLGRKIDHSSSANQRSVAGRRVLIVDDNEANREILEQQFDSWKAETDSACSADEALELLDRAEKAGSNFDLAVLDVHMPEKDGIELARAIRGRKNLSQPKLMLLSSVMAPASDDVIRELDISGQLTKPIRQSHLYDAIVRLLNERVAESMRIAALSPLVRMVGRVLLVEDNPVNQAVATGMLEALGVTVEVAENGEEAIEKVTSAAFDVVLMDCQMPVMDGFEATGFIRDHEQREGKSAVPIIALTANALKGDRENCLAAGMDDYLSKPFTGEELHSVLSQYLKVLPGSASKNPGKVSDERADSMLQQRSLP